MTKREFLQSLGAVPSLRLLPGAVEGVAADPAKFTPLDCSSAFSAAHADLAGIFRRPVALAREAIGRQSLRGIPFHFGPEDPAAKRYILLSQRAGQPFRANVEV
ncbi:MAG: hypothetical protein NTY38_14845, partial [Acidobacteria bacterium]|nr:hypothetical protein [Acidobacteriota bacterium]